MYFIFRIIQQIELEISIGYYLFINLLMKDISYSQIIKEDLPRTLQENKKIEIGKLDMKEIVQFDRGSTESQNFQCIEDKEKLNQIYHGAIVALRLQDQCGSGVLISPNIVLTSASNIYDNKKSKQNEITSAKVYIKACGLVEEYYQVEGWRYLPQFKNCQFNNKSKYDYAVIKLKQKIDHNFPMLTFLCQKCFSLSKQDPKLRVFGYPAIDEKYDSKNYKPFDSDGIKILLHQYGFVQKIENTLISDWIIKYRMNTLQGHNGCPIGLGENIIGIDIGHDEYQKCGRFFDIELIKDINKWCKQLRGERFKIYKSSLCSHFAQIEIYLQQIQIESNDEELKKAKQFHQKGKEYYGKSNYQKALDFFNQSLLIKQKIKGKGCIQSADSLNNMGAVYKIQKNYEKALDSFYNALQIFQRIKGKECIDSAKPLYNIGIIYRMQKNYEKALQFFKKSQKIKQTVNGKVGSIESIETLNNIGFAYEHLGNYEKALKYYKTQLEITSSIIGKQSIESAKALNRIGYVYEILQKYDQALDSFNKTLEIYQRIKGKQSIESADTFCNIGMVYKKEKQFEKALQFLYNSLEIYQKLKINGSIESAEAFDNIGCVHEKMGNYEKALHSFNKSLEIYQTIIGKGCIESANILHIMGNLSRNKKKYDKALQFYNRSLEIYQKKDCIKLAFLYHNIGLTYQLQKFFQKGLELYNKSLEIKQKIKGKCSIQCVGTLTNIALIYEQMKNYHKAVEFYQRADSICQEKDYKYYDYSLNCLNFGNFLHILKNYERAIDFLNKSLPYFKKTNSPDYQKGIDQIKVCKNILNTDLSQECKKKLKK